MFRTNYSVTFYWSYPGWCWRD